MGHEVAISMDGTPVHVIAYDCSVADFKFRFSFFFLSWHFRAFIRPNFYRRSGLRATISVPPEALTLSFIAYANQSLPQVHRLYSISRYAFSLELESYILDNGRDTLPFGY